MKESTITQQLNDEQRQAVTSDSPNVLVVAGAGSGKTRVLVHRIAWLLETSRAKSSEILAVTFTNKAAKEIHDRVAKLLGTSVHHMWVGTFHSQCLKVLRIHYNEANLDQHFQIIDSDEQMKLLKKIHKELNLTESAYPPKKSQYLIGQCKENFQHASDIDGRGDFDPQFVKVFSAYELFCQRQSLLDFTDLILRCYELLLNNEQIRTHFQNRFRYILVDEFQDTNRLQYAWLKCLGANSSITVVGDDDQSIYSWRGAIVGHLHEFEKEFKHTETVRLERNYRSTSTILSAANSLISNNTDRLGKNLWTDLEDGELIRHFTAYNEVDEAKFIVQCIGELSKDHTLDEFAVFYRSNAQSRAIEEVLNMEGIPYRIYGGFRFFDRAEIKDCLAYIRLWLNPHDDSAFERVVNLPARGIGQSSLEKIRQIARDQQISLWDSIEQAKTNGLLTKRAANAFDGFKTLILNAKSKTFERTDELAQYLIETSDLKRLYPNKTMEHTAKIENMDELVTALSQFRESELIEDNIRTALAHMTLDATQDNAKYEKHAVQLMTVHAAKGLEFTHVFLTGLEEGLFPHFGSGQDDDELEEERRLCYVGITRACQKLYITNAETRRIFGKEQFQRPSRFISEIPKELVLSVRSTQSNYATSQVGQVNPSHPYRLGARVHHGTFGDGTILNIEGDRENVRIQVHFESCGVKWLLSQYANLSLI